MILNEKQKEFLVALNKMFPNAETLSKKQLISVNKKLGLKSAPQWITRNDDLKLGNSMFKVPTEGVTIDNSVLKDTPKTIEQPASTNVQELHMLFLV